MKVVSSVIQNWEVRNSSGGGKTKSNPPPSEKSSPYAHVSCHELPA